MTTLHPVVRHALCAIRTELMILTEEIYTAQTVDEAWALCEAVRPLVADFEQLERLSLARADAILSAA